jgi:hypothetical protein
VVETGSLWTASPASQSDLSRFRLDLARRHRARIDRIVMLLCGEENLRVVELFAVDQRAEDPMMGTPSEVLPKQLRELDIWVVKPN